MDEAAPRLQVRRVPAPEKLIPPPNFGVVEDTLFRSGQPPNDLSNPFIRTLNLRTVVWLAPEQPHPRFVEFLQEEGIALEQLIKSRRSVEDATPNDPVSEENVLAALDIIINPRSGPTMVVCQQGRHRTGTVVGVFRRLQGWNLASIFEEYRRFAGQRVRLANEQFIELFDCDLVVLPS